MHHETKYARNGAYSVAYQIFGEGPIDIVLGLGWLSHLDALWEEPRFARFIGSFGAFGRVIAYDARGTGLSDKVPLSETVTLADRVADLEAVMAAAGAARPALLGMGASGLAFSSFAATYPERTRALVLINSAVAVDARDATGKPRKVALDLETVAPGAANEPAFVAWWDSYLRRCTGPGLARSLITMNLAIDVRTELPNITAPTLVLHRIGDRAIDVRHARALAAAIPGAILHELPGDDHLPFIGDLDTIVGEIEQFLTGQRVRRHHERELATVMAVEAVDVVETAVRLGDRRWTDLWSRVQGIITTEVTRNQGVVIGAEMDGTIASFPDPVRAMTCAVAVIGSASPLGIGLRAGVHTGEVAKARHGVAGVTVHLARRLASLADAGTVLLSESVYGMAIGGTLRMEPIGDYPMPGQPGTWRVYRIGGSGPATGRTGALAVDRQPANTLSRREREIAALLALSLANRQIADELQISVATVERHVANMLAKLGFRSRTQIAAWAVEQGLHS